MKDGFVYLLRNADGDLLYVGMTVNVTKRVFQHRRGKRWGHAIATVAAEGPMPLPLAEARERELIAALQPRHNIARTELIAGNDPVAPFLAPPIAVPPLEPRRKNTLSDPGRPRTVHVGLSLPSDLAAGVREEAERQGHHNVSRVIQDAVTEYLNRMTDPRAA